MTLVLRGSRAVEALGMTGLAGQGHLIPVLHGGAFSVRHAAPVVVHPQAFLTRGAGPRGRAGPAGLVAVCGRGGDSRRRVREGQGAP